MNEQAILDTIITDELIAHVLGDLCEYRADPLGWCAALLPVQVSGFQTGIDDAAATLRDLKGETASYVMAMLERQADYTVIKGKAIALRLVMDEVRYAIIWRATRRVTKNAQAVA